MVGNAGSWPARRTNLAFRIGKILYESSGGLTTRASGREVMKSPSWIIRYTPLCQFRNGRMKVVASVNPGKDCVDFIELEGVPILVESLRAAVGTFYYATSPRLTDFDPLRMAFNIHRSR